MSDIDRLFNQWIDEQDADFEEKEQFRRDPKAKLMFVKNMDRLITSDVSKFPPMKSTGGAAPFGLSEGQFASTEDRAKLQRKNYGPISPEMIRSGANIIPPAVAGAAGGPMGVAVGALGGLGADLFERALDSEDNPQKFMDASLLTRLASGPILSRLSKLKGAARLPAQTGYLVGEGALNASLNNKMNPDEYNNPLISGILSGTIGAPLMHMGNSFAKRKDKFTAARKLGNEFTQESAENIEPNVANLQKDIRYWMGQPAGEKNLIKTNEEIKESNKWLKDRYLKDVKTFQKKEKINNLVFATKEEQVNTFNERYLATLAERQEAYKKNKAVISELSSNYQGQREIKASEIGKQLEGPEHVKLAKKIFEELTLLFPDEHERNIDTAIYIADRTLGEKYKLQTPANPFTNTPSDLLPNRLNTQAVERTVKLIPDEDKQLRYLRNELGVTDEVAQQYLNRLKMPEQSSQMADLNLTRPPRNPLDFLQKQPELTKELPPALPNFLKTETPENLTAGREVAKRMGVMADEVPEKMKEHYKAIIATDPKRFVQEIFGEFFNPLVENKSRAALNRRVEQSLSLINRIASSEDKPKLMSAFRQGIIQNIFESGKVNPQKTSQVMQNLGIDTFEKVFGNRESYNTIMKLAEAAQGGGMGDKLRALSTQNGFLLALRTKTSSLRAALPSGGSYATAGAAGAYLGGIPGAAAGVGAVGGYKLYNVTWDTIARWASSPNNRMADIINALATNRGTYSERVVHTLEKYLDQTASLSSQNEKAAQTLERTKDQAAVKVENLRKKISDVF